MESLNASSACDEARDCAEYELEEGMRLPVSEDSNSTRHTHRDLPPAEPRGAWLSWFLDTIIKALVTATCGACGVQAPSDSAETGADAV
ncbi:hypothetical protein FKP32DRAFT_1670776 [Trametes sanguinea]|nr:hypothetical protein FKP32DRAFT_1670776 [Trametes sanguinea]